MSGQIFVSYRRDDSQGSTGRLCDHLAARFGRDKIFMDVDTIQPGVDFAEAIEEAVGVCDVLVAVIGKRWLSSSDARGTRRVDIPEDFVRLEIATALRRRIRVVPVLVEGALMPEVGEIPDDLKPLVRRNALEVSHTRFNSDCERLADAVKRVLETARVEQEPLEAERRQREEKDRLEAERRQKEEQERLKTERRQREEQERLEAELRETEGKKHLEATKTEPDKPSTRPETMPQLTEALPKDLPNTREQSGLPHFVRKWHYVPFVLVLLSYFLPFIYIRGNNGWFHIQQTGLHISGYSWIVTNIQEIFSENLLRNISLLSDRLIVVLAMLCPLIVLSSSFFSYKRKGILEVILSWAGFGMMVFLMIFTVPGWRWTPEFGIVLACIFAATGAVMKTYLFKHHP